MWVCSDFEKELVISHRYVYHRFFSMDFLVIFVNIKQPLKVTLKNIWKINIKALLPQTIGIRINWYIQWQIASLDARPILKYRSGNKRSNGDLCLKTHSKFILNVLRHFWMIYSNCLKTLRMNLECVLRRFRVTVLRRLTNYSKCLKTVWLDQTVLRRFD